MKKIILSVLFTFALGFLSAQDDKGIQPGFTDQQIGSKTKSITVSPFFSSSTDGSKLISAPAKAPKSKNDTGEKRLALVIGNNDYKDIIPLNTPLNDAKEMEKALQTCGFDVMVLENGTKENIERKINEFSSRLKSYDVGFFYFSGHGFDNRGKHYLVSVDSSSNPTDHSISAEYIFSKIESKGAKTLFVIFDTDRSELESMTTGNKEIFTDTSSYKITIPLNALVGFAAIPGGHALEGTKLSRYTELLLKHITTPGISVEEIFKRIRVDFKENKTRSQMPFEMSTLENDFYFLPVSEMKNRIDSESNEDYIEAEIRYIPQFNCNLNITISLGAYNFIPVGNNYRIKVKQGLYKYNIRGTINCTNGSNFVSPTSSGEIYISKNSILDVRLEGVNWKLSLTNTGRY
jgi:hypothetical protein